MNLLTKSIFIVCLSLSTTFAYGDTANDIINRLSDKISSIVKESLKIENLGNKMTENSLSVPLKEAREKFEKEYLTIQLKKFNGNISKTANFVGMERSALHRKLKGLGIKEFN